MESPLGSNLFEWLLAGWAGYGKNPEEVFPSLRQANRQELAAELAGAIKTAAGPRSSLPAFHPENSREGKLV